MESGLARELLGWGTDSVGCVLPGLLPFFLDLFATLGFTGVISTFFSQPSLPTSFWMEWNGSGDSRKSCGSEN